MAEKKGAIVDVLEELIIKVSLPKRPAREFLKFVERIVTTTHENYEFIAGVSYLVVKISLERRSQFYYLLSKFCREYGFTFKKP